MPRGGQQEATRRPRGGQEEAKRRPRGGQEEATRRTMIEKDDEEDKDEATPPGGRITPARV